MPSISTSTPSTPGPRAEDAGFSTVHPLTGPVHIEGAEPGDVLRVRILDVAPGPWAFTLIASEVPPDMEYLEAQKIGALENLSKDISLAARNALFEIDLTP